MESCTRSILVDRSTVAKVDDMDKKKKRRSNRRDKNNCSLTVNGIHEEAFEFQRPVHSPYPPTFFTGSSSGQHGLDSLSIQEEGLAGVSEAAFNSVRTMHLNGHPDNNNMTTQLLSPSDLYYTVHPNACSLPVSASNFHCKEFAPYANDLYTQRKLFSQHMSEDDIDEALRIGYIFKASFHVNAHNRFEAYCKIEGLDVDVLVNGLSYQNRAVDGDMVAIEIDPPSSWTRIKEPAILPNDAELVRTNNLFATSPDFPGDCSKGKNKVNADCEFVSSGASTSNCTNNISRELFDGSCYFEVNDNIGRTSSTNTLEYILSEINSFPPKRPTGKVVGIIELSRRRNAVVGFLSAKKWLRDMKKTLLSSSCKFIQLTPTDSKLPKLNILVNSLPVDIRNRLANGDKTVDLELVAAKIEYWEEESFFPRGCVVWGFGKCGEMEPHLAAILFENSVCSTEFSTESLSCLPHALWEVPMEEISNRRDFRSVCTFTIDPSTASDLDDALSIEKLSDGIVRVGVHIADVSYFVKPETAIDVEAQIRSRTVYMSQCKIPMLPPLLSDNFGSLVPGVDRLAFSIVWDITSAGDVADRWVGRSVMRSCCKLSYEHAQDIIDGRFDVVSHENLPELNGLFGWTDVVQSVKLLYERSANLRKKRFEAGALKLDVSKVMFLFDESGIPYDSKLSERVDSNNLVEEFMLLANTAAAEIVARAFPKSALLRRHPEPDIRKLREFETFCSKHGLELNISSSGNIHNSLVCIQEKLGDDSTLFDILVSYAIKPMKSAVYFCTGGSTGTENTWAHYALAVPVYTHFTSPLRRYPDVMVHRMLAAIVEAEALYCRSRIKPDVQKGDNMSRVFTGVKFDENAAKSAEVLEALSAAAKKHNVPCAETLSEIAAYCNERALASRNVKDACDKLYMWIMLKKKEVLLSQGRVLGLGPRFMSIYVNKLAIERRIYYDEVEGLMAEWLEGTSTLILSLITTKRSHRGSWAGKRRPIEDVALLVSPLQLMLGLEEEIGYSEKTIQPAVFPLTLHLLSTVPVALSPAGGADGPIDIKACLYIGTYLA